ncbi:2Fe-2S iron-sulfur cluster-binding protein [Aminobacter ciceronei]|uniref:2Fe-2S iron-sulfur cluster-binding protein n=1 Tax=Aminobacter ciceronei TaxID=150723 RepID=UPI0015F89E93|nr:2Fe-2S iron-sulfur cluster-binding protein [Aminobacter ciceronei]
MSTITYISNNDSPREVRTDVGMSVMEAAIAHNIPGIIGECGGACACATCHIYLSSEAFEKYGSPNVFEKDMLEFATAEARSTSRLGCQVKVHPDDPPLTVTIPDSQ